MSVPLCPVLHVHHLVEPPLTCFRAGEPDLRQTSHWPEIMQLERSCFPLPHDVQNQSG
uniref:Uncharacterized protein n=1 Tax=Molossus molossus TaxID=27622 RepID=A0A7J8HF97_MOLMO|nr:hypothetical protein HJG59_003440 [Molossus molossus]